MKVSSREQAWAEVNKIFPTDYEKDYASSERAGYDIYRHHELNYYSRICDLGDRLEVLTGEYGENMTNIWIEEPKPQTPVTFKVTVTYQIHDGSVMTKELAGVNKVETIFEVIGEKPTQILKVCFGGYNGATWAAGSVLNINMTPERK